MNAGVSEAISPREFGEIVDWVEVVRPDGVLQRLQKEDLNWHYRSVEGWQPGIVFRVGVSCDATPDLEILGKVRLANQVRLQKQPLDLPSCGSVFINPPHGQSRSLD